MAEPLSSPNDAAGTEVEVSEDYWEDRPLPDTVTPSFATCNISRSYELKVRVGLKAGKDQLSIGPLYLPVEVSSGIALPAELQNEFGPFTIGPSLQSQGHDDAPPSYKDAMAENLPLFLDDVFHGG